MKLYVLKPIKLKKAGRVFDVSPGAMVEISKPEKAQSLIDGGYVRPVLPPDESGKVKAVRIFSKILSEDVWVVTHRDGLAFIPEGTVVYLPEEIRNLKGASEDEIRAVHKVKKEIGGALIAVTSKGGRV